jgi:hypothetical protein
MDNVKQKNWFSATAFAIIALSILSFSYFLAKAHSPNRSNSLIPHQSDRISSWPFNSSRRQDSQQASAEKALLKKLFFQINRKQSAGKAEFIYRGLVGQSEFQIDIIIPELDPQVFYPYRFKISEAKKSFRLANHEYKLISAKKGALQLKQIN